MRILGIDPGLRTTGFGVVEKHGNQLLYVARRLFHVNAHNDLVVLDEIHGLMREIRDAWEGVPSLVPASNRPAGMMN